MFYSRGEQKQIYTETTTPDAEQLWTIRTQRQSQTEVCLDQDSSRTRTPRDDVWKLSESMFPTVSENKWMFESISSKTVKQKVEIQ